MTPELHVCSSTSVPSASPQKTGKGESLQDLIGKRNQGTRETSHPVPTLCISSPPSKAQHWEDTRLGTEVAIRANSLCQFHQAGALITHRNWHSFPFASKVNIKSCLSVHGAGTCGQAKKIFAEKRPETPQNCPPHPPQ